MSGIEEAGASYHFLVVGRIDIFRRFDMDKSKAAAITASIAGAASFVWVSTATCYAAEAADVEPIPLGATLTGMGGTTTTSSFAVTVTIPNPMADDPIQVVNGCRICAECLRRAIHFPAFFVSPPSLIALRKVSAIIKCAGRHTNLTVSFYGLDEGVAPGV
jgi:hypothetical protein